MKNPEIKQTSITQNAIFALKMTLFLLIFIQQSLLFLTPFFIEAGTKHNAMQNRKNQQQIKPADMYSMELHHSAKDAGSIPLLQSFNIT
nr:MAG TPA: hypothetical protein [Caudoviricetes sp.]